MSEGGNEQATYRKRKKIIMIAVIVALVIILIVGLSVGLTARKESGSNQTISNVNRPGGNTEPVEESEETPLITEAPVRAPVSNAPTRAAIRSPTKTPSLAPIRAPTKAPSLVPTASPTTLPPTGLPSERLSFTPTSSFSPSVSDIPSMIPTDSMAPATTTQIPTASFTNSPTRKPTALPTVFKIRNQWPKNAENDVGTGIRLRVENAMSNRWQEILFDVLTNWERGDPDVIQFSRKQVTIDPDCSPVLGVIKLCNSDKGRSGGNRGFNSLLLDDNGQIAGATVELNDFYMAEDLSRQYYLCQFIGHALGLPALDEDYFNANKGSCMDYSNSWVSDPEMLTPSRADFEKLASFYG